MQGAAILTALFIMTLIAIVATAMTSRLQLDIYRTRLIVTHDKLYLSTQAVTFWALGQLGDVKNKYTKSNKAGVIAEYPKNMQSLVDGVTISGQLYDMQARFNLNNLLERKLIPVFINLLGKTSQLDNTKSLNLALSVQDWLTPYDLARGKDDYTSWYLAQKPPYYPSRQRMSSASELRLVKDVSAQTYEELLPFLSVLPETTPVNINTASKQVLMSLGNGFNDSQINELIMARGNEGIKDLKDISEIIKKLNLPNDQITIQSTYFLNVAQATSEEFKITVYTLLKRTIDKNGKLTVSIIRESIGGF